MRSGGGARIALEAGFLLVVAAVLAAAEVDAVWVVLVMLLAWVVVALLEWAAWREEPHWGSGAPPRYHVPGHRLPPRPPSRELPAFTAYPRPRRAAADAPTWIAPPELRQEVLGWPAPEPLPEAADGPGGWPERSAPRVGGDGWSVEELPAEPVEAVAAAVETRVAAPAPAVAAPVAAPLAPARPTRLARHRIDPFEEPETRRRRWRRRIEEQGASTLLPVLPRHAPVPARQPDRTDAR